MTSRERPIRLKDKMRRYADQLIDGGRLSVVPFILAGVLLLTISVGMTQSIGKGTNNRSGHQPKSTAQDAPVTKQEVADTLRRIEVAILRVVVGSKQIPAKKTPGAARATRSEIIGELFRLFKMSQPKFKFTPRMVAFEGKQLSIPGADDARPMLEKLIASRQGKIFLPLDLRSLVSIASKGILIATKKR
jgi:hypothetical protein